MNFKTIKFEQLFPTGAYANQRLSVEMDIETPHPSTGESNWDAAIDAFRKAQDLVNTAFEKMNPHIEWSEPAISPLPEVHVRDERNLDPVNEIISGIRSSNELKVLESYKLIARTKPEFQAEYDKRYLELTKTKAFL